MPGKRKIVLEKEKPRENSRGFLRKLLYDLECHSSLYGAGSLHFYNYSHGYFICNAFSKLFGVIVNFYFAIFLSEALAVANEDFDFKKAIMTFILLIFIKIVSE